MQAYHRLASFDMELFLCCEFIFNGECLFFLNIELLYYNHYRKLICIFLGCKAVYFLLIKRLVSVPLPFSPLREEFRLTAGFCLLLFSIEPVDIWNCEILLTASLDCTVRLWTMEGHFVGELFSWTRFLSVNSINFQRFRAVGSAFILWSGRHAEACPILPQFWPRLSPWPSRLWRAVGGTESEH